MTSNYTSYGQGGFPQSNQQQEASSETTRIPFTDQTTVTYEHNRGYVPVFWLEDLSGHKFTADESSTDSLITVNFSEPKSGYLVIL